MANLHGHFAWYELMTSDVEGAKAFYTEVVGWGTRDASAPGRPYTLFTAGTTSVGGLLELPAEAISKGARASWLGYVTVNDMETTLDEVRRLGGVVHVPPTDIPSVSCFSLVADPQMATFAMFKWLDASRERSTELSAPGHVGWHELLAVEWQQVWPFYCELFGWQKARADVGVRGTYQRFSSGGRAIGGMFTKPSVVPIPFWLYYFNTGDIDSAAKRVRSGNGQILNDAIEVPGGAWVMQCADPQGAIFGLIGERRHMRIVVARSAHTRRVG